MSLGPEDALSLSDLIALFSVVIFIICLLSNSSSFFFTTHILSFSLLPSPSVSHPAECLEDDVQQRAPSASSKPLKKWVRLARTSVGLPSVCYSDEASDGKK